MPPGIQNESGIRHAAGEAIFPGDRMAVSGALEIALVTSPHAAALITGCDTEAASAVEGVCAVLLAEDIPGVNRRGTMPDGEPLLAGANAVFLGQVVAVVAGEMPEACERAAALVDVKMQAMRSIVSIEEAIALRRFHPYHPVIESGDVESALESAPRQLAGALDVPAQAFGSRESPAACAIPDEDGAVRIFCASQDLAGVQEAAAAVLGISSSRVAVECLRLGEPGGGSRMQAERWASLAALAASKTGRPVRLQPARDPAPASEGEPALRATYSVGFDANGRVSAVRISLFLQGGCSAGAADTVLDCALLHLDNAYHIPHTRFEGRVCKSNLAPDTLSTEMAAAAGMLVIEEIIGRVAGEVRLPAEEVRERNFYRVADAGGAAPCGQETGADRILALWEDLLDRSEFRSRRAEIDSWNAESRFVKRGLAITPVKAGYPGTPGTGDAAAAAVRVFSDGSVQICHSGVETGQGIHTMVVLAASEALGVEPGRIRVVAASTDAVSGGVSGTPGSCDSSALAVRRACATLRERLQPVAAQLLAVKTGAPAAGEPEFAGGRIYLPEQPEVSISIAEAALQASRSGISTLAEAAYRTPGLHYDRRKGRGKPFRDFSMGAAVCEVEVDGFTGEFRVLRTDLLQDLGERVIPEIDRDRIRTGFIRGQGWLTGVARVWGETGQSAPWNPRIPSLTEVPLDFRADVVEPSRGKGCAEAGEVSIGLAVSAREALRNAIAAFGTLERAPEPGLPATPQSVFWALPASKAAGGPEKTFVRGEFALPEEARDLTESAPVKS